MKTKDAVAAGTSEELDQNTWCSIPAATSLGAHIMGKKKDKLAAQQQGAAAAQIPWKEIDKDPMRFLVAPKVRMPLSRCVGNCLQPLGPWPLRSFDVLSACVSWTGVLLQYAETCP